MNIYWLFMSIANISVLRIIIRGSGVQVPEPLFGLMVCKTIVCRPFFLDDFWLLFPMRQICAAESNEFDR